MKTIDEFASAVETYIRPATLPIAIKMLETEENLPENIRMPKKDFGVQLIPCQAFFLSRKHGIPLAMLKGDFNTDLCATGSIIFGIAPPIDWWLDGNTAFETYVKTLEAAATAEKNVFRFEFGRYAGFLSSPLRKAKFEPDVVMVYCNSAQAMSLVAASRYEDGLPITTTISARAVCSDSVVQSIQTRKCQLSIPCGGDRSLAYAGVDEIVFTAPVDKLHTIIEGLENSSKTRAPPIMRILGVQESSLDKKYMELARRIRKKMKEE